MAVVAVTLGSLVWILGQRGDAEAAPAPSPDPSLAAFLASDTELAPVEPEPAGDGLALGVQIDLTLDDLDGWWAGIAASHGVVWWPIAGVAPYLPSSGRVPPCPGGSEDPEFFRDQAFYCPVGDVVAWDAEGLFPDLYETHAPFAVSVALAHEMAHAAQLRFGVDATTRTLELQADCLAGAWAASLDDGAPLAAGHDDFLDDAEAFFDRIGDPILRSFADDVAHGSGPIRTRAYADGLARGAPACLDYHHGLPVHLRDEPTLG